MMRGYLSRNNVTRRHYRAVPLRAFWRLLPCLHMNLYLRAPQQIVPTSKRYSLRIPRGKASKRVLLRRQFLLAMITCHQSLTRTMAQIGLGQTSHELLYPVSLVTTEDRAPLFLVMVAIFSLLLDHTRAAPRVAARLHSMPLSPIRAHRHPQVTWGSDSSIPVATVQTRPQAGDITNRYDRTILVHRPMTHTTVS